MDPDIKAMFLVLIEGQTLTDKNLRSLGETVERLTENVNSFVTSSEARFKRLEDNLDGLIRAITQEHSNGKH
jgi:hypothetical protein